MTDYNPYTSLYQPDNDPCKGMSDEERISLAVKQIVGYILVLAIAMLLCALLSSCSTQQQLTEHHVRTIVADMMAQQSQQDTHVTADSYYLDSALTAQMQIIKSEINAREQQTETVTETVTTAIDSLGRQLRTEQRTTTRILSREEQQHIDHQIQQVEQRWQSRYNHLDSLYRTMESRIQAHWEDSTATHKDVQKQTNAALAIPLWQSLWMQFRGVLIGMAIILFIILGKRHLKRLTRDD